MKTPREFWVSEHGDGATIDWDGPPNYVPDYFHAGYKVYHVREIIDHDPRDEALKDALAVMMNLIRNNHHYIEDVWRIYDWLSKYSKLVGDK